MDTNPLAADPAVVLASRDVEFTAGLQVLSVLAEGRVHVCHQQGKEIPGQSKTPATFHAFEGPHPPGWREPISIPLTRFVKTRPSGISVTRMSLRWATCF